MVQAMRAHRANLRSSGRAHRGGGPTEEVQLPAITCFGHPKAELFSEICCPLAQIHFEGRLLRRTAQAGPGLKPGSMRKRVWHDRKNGIVWATPATRLPPAAVPASRAPVTPLHEPSDQN